MEKVLLFASDVFQPYIEQNSHLNNAILPTTSFGHVYNHSSPSCMWERKEIKYTAAFGIRSGLKELFAFLCYSLMTAT